MGHFSASADLQNLKRPVNPCPITPPPPVPRLLFCKIKKPSEVFEISCPTNTLLPCSNHIGHGRRASMRKDSINTAVNAVSFVVFSILLSTGMVLAFRLPPGSGHGRRGGNGAAEIFGLGRHDWGDVHRNLAIFFVLLVAAHLYLHWPWLVETFWGRTRTASRSKRSITVGILAFAALMIIAPWLAVEN